MILKFRSILLVTILLSMVLLAASSPANTKQQQPTTDKRHTEPTPSNRFDSSLYITTRTAIRQFKKEPGKNILVDIRRKADFDKARISGSINLPVYAVKTKPFLKSKPVVLIDEGYGSPDLQRACSRLNEAGFQARILFGGLKLWRELGGPVAGDFFYLKSLSRITPADYHTSQQLGHWTVIDVMAAPPSEKLLPTFSTARHIPFAPRSETFAASLSELRHSIRRNRFTAVLVLDRDGTGYEQMEDAFASARLVNLYYLEGGVDGYRQHLEKLARMKNHEKGKRISPEKCATCP